MRPRRSANPRQAASYDDKLYEALRGVLLVAVKSEPSAAGGIDSIQCRACAALYDLLTDHPVDRRGRCRSCRWPGGVLGLRRRCRVHWKARVWLQQPAELLRSQLAYELGLTNAPPAPDRATHARPDTDHGGAGEHPDASGPAVAHPPPTSSHRRTSR